MSMAHIALLIACVGAISAGQLLFKKAGGQLSSSGSWLDINVLLTIGAAAIIYGAATLLWIYLLKDIPLSKAYPFMALSFVLVPIGSLLLFQESISGGYVIGTITLVAGLLIIARSG